MTHANAWPHAPRFRIRSGTTREAGHPEAGCIQRIAEWSGVGGGRWRVTAGRFLTSLKNAGWGEGRKPARPTGP